MGDNMKTFYLFSINNMFLTKYNKKTISTYKILNNIYKNYDEKLFNKFTTKINKEKIDIQIYLNHRNDFYYYKKNNKHIIDNANEYVEMEINNNFITIKTNKENNTLLNDLINMKEKLFLIDFENKNYFWLKEKNICYNY